MASARQPRGGRPPRYRRRSLPNPTPTRPEPPSPEIRRLLAWIDANLAHDDLAGVLADFETALLREAAAAAGRLSAADRLLPHDTPGELRAIFALQGEALFHALLGYWDLELNWHPGLAGLREHEAEVATLSLGLEHPTNPDEEANQLWEIRAKLVRYHGRRAPSLESIARYLRSAKQKLRDLLGLGDMDERPRPTLQESARVLKERWSQRAWPAPWEAQGGPPPMPEDEENPDEDPLP